MMRVIGSAGAVLLLVLLAGATYQGLATALERRKFPRPGPLVNVGDHQLHIQCLGKGAPVVVLEAPAAGMSAAWGWVEPPVARTTRVCSYDRAGLGWSERADGPYDPGNTTAELRKALEGAGSRGPFIIAGQGLGAAFAMLFASRFPNDTAALVLVDAPRSAAPAERDAAIRFARTWPWLARIGALRAATVLSRRADGLPPSAGGALGMFLNRPDHLTQAARELSHWDEVIGRAAAAALPDVPVTRLDIAGNGRVAFLTDKTAAERVAAAILDAGSAVRKRDKIRQSMGRPEGRSLHKQIGRHATAGLTTGPTYRVDGRGRLSSRRR